jgi:signal transduction histidine kinase
MAVPSTSTEEPSKLHRMLEAMLLLAAERELSGLLHHLVEEARAIAGARYGALGILNDDDHTALTELIVVGPEEAASESSGARPTEQMVLELLNDPQSMRSGNIGSRSQGSGSQRATSFLGVPIMVRDEIYGRLFLTDKTDLSEFTIDDETFVKALALAAGVVIENTRLNERIQDIVVYEDRDRLARDLHDTVIQQLFATGLHLQSLAGTAATAGPGEISDRLLTAITDIDETIRQVRMAIYELGSADIDRGVRANVLSLIRELEPVVGFEIRVSFDGPVDSEIPDQVSEHLLVAIRETVTNIGRHAKASEATLALSVSDGQCLLQVIDDGRGFVASEPTEGGRGLVNLRARAEMLQGSFAIGAPEIGGTSVSWQVPI